MSQNKIKFEIKMCFELSKNKKYHIFDTITMNNLVRKTPESKKCSAINKGDDCTTELLNTAERNEERHK